MTSIIANTNAQITHCTTPSIPTTCELVCRTKMTVSEEKTPTPRWNYQCPSYQNMILDKTMFNFYIYPSSASTENWFTSTVPMFTLFSDYYHLLHREDRVPTSHNRGDRGWSVLTFNHTITLLNKQHEFAMLNLQFDFHYWNK